MLKLEDLNLDMIASAMQDDGSMGLSFYLDLKSGEVVTAEFEDDHLAAIGRVESHESYRQMEEFTAALPEEEARIELEQALIRRKPFVQFKRTLGAFPAEREAWLTFKEEAMRAVVVRWLVGIEAIEDPEAPTTDEITPA
ncbi:UPF0158 family protein [Paeniglutamicibacter cryotolerans]|uniref:DNA mismatch repair ATPase MutS n=1 Tax=Paeniglutamicibacter cryotolerans TaxID=670079 RepID=A0A839QI78_9MICC|nr:UPF0158 family protein [Paeniglutamicibacter cryotolerans]MBB2995570.1 DNA mismatch repair ATPase MutS [Paeniglutamicibacter cryotolerans]